MPDSPSDGAVVLHVVARDGSRAPLTGDAVIACLGDGREVHVAQRSRATRPGRVLVRGEFVPPGGPPRSPDELPPAVGLLELRPG